MQAKIDAIQKTFDERIDAVQTACNQRIDQLQASYDAKLNDARYIVISFIFFSGLFNMIVQLTANSIKSPDGVRE